MSEEKENKKDNETAGIKALKEHYEDLLHKEQMKREEEVNYLNKYINELERKHIEEIKEILRNGKVEEVEVEEMSEEEELYNNLYNKFLGGK